MTECPRCHGSGTQQRGLAGGKFYALDDDECDKCHGSGEI